MNVWPLRFRNTSNNDLLFADETGSWFRSSENFLRRYAEDTLTEADCQFLKRNGHAFEKEGELSHFAYTYRYSIRQASIKPLSYVMLIPTLRCNLSCTYCQVSRAAENAKGYDWDEDTLKQVLSFLDGLSTDTIKVEFQGGEPLLRVDLLERVREFCRERFTTSQFVVCTNLQQLGTREWAFIEAADTYASTSIDGDFNIHTNQRTQNKGTTDAFFANVKEAATRLTKGHLSALPTIDVNNPPDFATLIDTYESLGISSIFLRPINHQGFARRRTKDSEEVQKWNALHAKFMDFIIERNFRTKRVVEEYYFSLCLKRILKAGHDSYVDLRNPSLFATDYIVIDYDGKLYPTDESRMLSRIGHVDLAVGHTSTGIDTKKAAELSASSFNNFNPDCIHCPYQPFCGTDIVDDISRYNRVDIPKADTWFCMKQLSIFDRVFDAIYSADEAVQFSLASWAGLGSWPSSLQVQHR
jgi:His-Xaa-Ser system radical SAM maturase HxsB